MKQVALFAIPGCVSFPYSQVPLHVFEPRYRDMVNYCLNKQVMMGVCHTQKVLHQAKENQSLQEALNSNQSTYKPHQIFSIGKVDLITTLPDGRMQIVVNMLERVKLERQVQTLPFSLVEVSSLPDTIDSNDLQDAEILKQKIIKRLLALSAAAQPAKNLFKFEAVEAMEVEEFSYRIFSTVRLTPDSLQQILEMTSVAQRLRNLLRLLNS